MERQRLMELAGVTKTPSEELKEVLWQMHKIINPGEYGLGDEPESVAQDDKAAWERLGSLLDQALQLADKA